jgi:hypothetical protein
MRHSHETFPVGVIGWIEGYEPDGRTDFHRDASPPKYVEMQAAWDRGETEP